MNRAETETTITVNCPSGHRIRGRADLVGRTVRCPKCRSTFLFESSASASNRKEESRKVTDTGVMRILGDMQAFPDEAENNHVAFRPCSRCGVAIPETLSVCNHCNCYVGIMPSFLREMASQAPQRN